jgi:chromate transporter
MPTPTPTRPRRPHGGHLAHSAEVLAVMGKHGTIAFGGPAVHVAMLRDETVRRRRWLEDAELLDLFGAVSVLPGPSSARWPSCSAGGSRRPRGRAQGRLAMASLAAVSVAALAAYLAGVNVLVILAAAGLVVTLVANRRRLRPCRARAAAGLLAAALPARRHPVLAAIAGESSSSAW